MTDATQHPDDQETNLNQQLDAYVGGTADEAETARIEEELISNPALAAQLDVRRRIKGGLELLEQRGQLSPLLKPESRGPGFRLAMAASLFAVLIAGALLFRNMQTGTSIGPALLAASSLDGRQVNRSVILARTRGEAQRIVLRKDDSIIQLRLLLNEDVPGELQLRLRRPDTTDAAAVLAIPPASNGFAEVYLDVRHVAPGRHRLQVSSADREVETFDLVFELAP